MNRYTDELKLKLAWQAAYELRTCPPDEILLAEPIDENLRKHLAICHLCRERRALNADERQAWDMLKSRFAAATVQPAIGTARQSGQVWTINSKAGGWDHEGRYLNPPAVLLLEEQQTASEWKVAQLYQDKRLIGQGDVELGDSFGFAQAWNCYQLADHMLDKLIGCVTQEQLAKVLSLSDVAADEAPAVNSVLAFFREMERGVSNCVTTKADIQGHSVASTTEVIPGLKFFVTSTKDFVLEATQEALNVLSRSYKPALIMRSSTPNQSGRYLSNDEIKSLGQICNVVPTELILLEGSMILSLKWLQHRPEIQPKIIVELNLPEPVQAKIDSATCEKIIISHTHIFTESPNIRAVAIRGNQDTLTITISLTTDK